MKILFLTLYPENIASSRLRIYQYRPYLEKVGLSCSIKPILPKNIFLRFYNKKETWNRIIFHSAELLNRFKDILNSSFFDLVVVQKGLSSINFCCFEKLLKICKKKIIYDFDDTVFGLTQTLPNYLRFIQDKNQNVEIARIAKLVIAGNSHLAQLAKQFNDSVYVLPTAVDTDVFKLRFTALKVNKRVTIGWTGSKSTNFYVNNLLPILNKLSAKYALRFKLISSDLERIQLNRLSKDIDFEFVPWRQETEVADLSDIDIGTMPLNFDYRSMGKCGFKALQFMALGIPTVSTPVGINIEIIQDDVNGFLALKEEEWISKLALLIEDQELRKRLGQAGRNTVEEKYSLKVNAPKFKRLIEEAMG
jgi:glycosyltransferase involved in cell wall biosynthesis